MICKLKLLCNFAEYFRDPLTPFSNQEGVEGDGNI